MVRIEKGGKMTRWPKTSRTYQKPDVGQSAKPERPAKPKPSKAGGQGFTNLCSAFFSSRRFPPQQVAGSTRQRALCSTHYTVRSDPRGLRRAGSTPYGCTVHTGSAPGGGRWCNDSARAERHSSPRGDRGRARGSQAAYGDSADRTGSSFPG